MLYQDIFALQTITKTINMKNTNKQQLVQTFYKVMNYIVMEEPQKTIQLPYWLNEITATVQTNQLNQDDIRQVLRTLKNRMSSYYGEEVAHKLLNSTSAA
jgi:hypothetical protein